MRERILESIRRLAGANGGQPPGRRVFEIETGIRESEWSGVLWARWGDALVEAGYEPNQKQGKLDEDFVLEKLAQVVRYYKKIPTSAELRMYKRLDSEFPSHNTFSNHFSDKIHMTKSLINWLDHNSLYRDVSGFLHDSSILKQTQEPEVAKFNSHEGFVYLIRSGSYFKIGRSDDLERRVKEIRIALPDKATLEHAIRTDDPPGIEAYWHRRFADRRVNGEWFKLTPADVAAFKRRKYQ